MLLALKPTKPTAPPKSRIPRREPPALPQLGATSLPTPAREEMPVRHAPRTVTISPRTIFFTLDTVRDLRGVDSDTILAEVDEGRFRWVWDLNSGGGTIRQLRFLAHELCDPAAVAGLELNEVFFLILGIHRQSWSGGNLARLFHLHRPVLHRLFNEGQLVGQKRNYQWHTNRAELTRFLTARLLR